jgi:sulfate transport system permease protein
MSLTVAAKPQPSRARTAPQQRRLAITEPRWVQLLLIAAAVSVVGLLLVVPLAAVFYKAFSLGAGVYWRAITDRETLAAVALTLKTAAVAVPASALFGLCAAWALGKVDFRGKSVLTTLIDLPFSVSTVIAGLIFVLLLGKNSWLGGYLEAAGIKVIFATPGIVIATMFVVAPLVARELIPLMQSQGNDEEEAAVVLGASGWQTFWRVTLPNIKWGLLYGIILCNARAMGEFGAVAVVSGRIRGQTNTIPLHVECLYGGSPESVVGAFAVASLLALLGLVTLAAKRLLEWKAGQTAV